MQNKRNLRIDYSKYEVDEVAETIADAMLFPFYVGKVLAVVLVFFIVLYGVLAYFYTGHIVFGILFFLLSYIVSIPSIALITAIRLIYTIRDDIVKVFEICVETTVYIYEDVKLIGEQKEAGVSAVATFDDVFRGVAMYVIQPSMNRVLRKRIKFLAGPFIFLINQVFKLVVIRKQPKFIVTEKDDKHIHVEVDNKSLDEKIIGGGSKATHFAMGLLTIPLYIAVFVYGFVNLLLVWLFTWIF